MKTWQILKICQVWDAGMEAQKNHSDESDFWLCPAIKEALKVPSPSG
jgi:hypothetical protein